MWQQGRDWRSNLHDRFVQERTREDNLLDVTTTVDTSGQRETEGEDGMALADEPNGTADKQTEPGVPCVLLVAHSALLGGRELREDQLDDRSSRGEKIYTTSVFPSPSEAQLMSDTWSPNRLPVLYFSHHQVHIIMKKMRCWEMAVQYGTSWMTFKNLGWAYELAENTWADNEVDKESFSA